MKFSLYFGLLSLLASSTLAHKGPVDEDLPGSMSADGHFMFAIETTDYPASVLTTPSVSSKCKLFTTISTFISYSTASFLGGEYIRTDNETATITTTTCSYSTTFATRSSLATPPSSNNGGTFFKVLDKPIGQNNDADLSGICYSADTPVISLYASMLHNRAGWSGYFTADDVLTFASFTPGNYTDNTGFSFTSDAYVAMDQTTDFTICQFDQIKNGSLYAKVYHMDLTNPMSDCTPGKIRYFQTFGSC